MKKIEQSAVDPLKIYEARQAQFQNEIAETEIASSRFSNARALVFLVGVVVGWLALIRLSIAVEWFFVPLLVFCLLVWQHLRVKTRLRKAKRAQDFYSQRISLINGHWEESGQASARYIDPSHPYTSDLDIFGSGSLFDFLNCTRTRLGADTLAQWLSQSADPETVALRQSAVKELSNHVEFREALALLEPVSDNDLSNQDIRNWINDDYPLRQWQRVAATVLGVLAFLFLIVWLLGYGSWPLMLIIMLEIPLYLSCFRHIKRMARQAGKVSSTLADLQQVLASIEQEKFHSVLLRQLLDPLQSKGAGPSSQISRLYALLEKFSQCMGNQLIMPFALLFGIPVHLAFRLEHWRRHIGPNIEHWMDAVGQVEALASLATYGFEHPENAYPVVVTSSNNPMFNASALSHPLIPRAQRVPNDIRLGVDQQLVMVSGSNMSGKSTLLRSIGISAVMASCGAPVQARKLELSDFNIGCAMRAQDSLRDGSSLFYAVISRIKCVVDLAAAKSPVLFLLDEILQGTNSQDRLVGARGVIHQLLDHNAVGLVTTHDLALTRIVDSLENKAINIHFEDQFVDGEILFDYKIRSGIIEKSNGLALMRMIGLNVDA